jgi:hypothetical protein
MNIRVLYKMFFLGLCIEFLGLNLWPKDSKILIILMIMNH